MRSAAILLGMATMALTSAAGASIAVTSGTFSQATLAVDGKGLASVSWLQAGGRQTLFVPRSGQVFHGGSLSGPDVSRRAQLPGLPLALVVRRTPDGTLWALQRWQLPGSVPELHLARWRGRPTTLSLALTASVLEGKVLFHGRPVTGFSTTPAGKRLRIYVYLDCFRCPGNPSSWTEMLGVAPRADGTFSVSLRPSWRGTRYRASVAGPNIGTTRAPDAQVVISAPAG